MSGIVTYYRFDITQPGSFLRSGSIYTNRYLPLHNFLSLHTVSRDFEENQRVFDAVIPGWHGFLIEDRQTYQMKLRRPLRERVYKIEIEACCVRDAINLFHSHGQINHEDRAEIGDSVRKLEESIEYHAKIGEKIESSQQDVIEAFIEPYVDDLKEHFSPQELEQAIEDARMTMLLEEFEEGFRLYMPLAMKENWLPEAREDILNALYVVGRVLAGKANLESALLHSGSTLPNLDVQKRIVMQKLGLINEPPPAKKARCH